MAASSSLYQYLDLDPTSPPPPEEDGDDPYARRLSMGAATTPSVSGVQVQLGPAATAAAAAIGPSPAGGGYATPSFEGHAAGTAAATPASGAATQEQFATPATLGECIAFLRPSLEAAGVRSRLPDAGAAAADPTAALASALCVAYDLLRLVQRSGEQRERQEELISKLRVEARTADRAAQRLQGHSEQQLQEAASLKIKLRQLDSWYRSEVDRWTLERDELVRRNTQLEQRHAQWVHEMRRRDGEIEKLQGRLRALLKANTESRMTGLDEPTEHRASPRAGSGHYPAGNTRQQAARQRQQQQQHAPALAEARRVGNGVGNNSSGSDRTGSSRPRSGATTARRTPAGSLCPGPASEDAAADDAIEGATFVNPAAAWHEVSAKLAALRVRARRVAVNAGAPDCPSAGASSESLAALAQQAGTPHERLLVAKLMEASCIMQEQEQTLKVAMAALAGGQQAPGE